jgi:hypothetical protein
MSEYEVNLWKRKCEAAESEVKKLKDQLRQQKRVTALVRAMECDEAKAAEMVEKLAGLDDNSFKAHADYMADRLAGYKKATKVGLTQPPTTPAGAPNTERPAVTRPPQATNLPAPNAEAGKLVTALFPQVEKVRSAVADYMADQFGIDIDVEDEDQET